MPSGGSALRYAQAVFDIARDQDTFDAWRDDLQTLGEILGIPEVQNFLDAPRVSLDEKQSLLDQHLASLSPLARNLASVLVRRGRVHLAPGIFQEYEGMLDEERGVVSATVTTAVPLDANLQARIEQVLQRETGRQLRLSTAVDPDIVGGIVACMGDKVIDGSTRTRLKNLRDWLREEAAS